MSFLNSLFLWGLLAAAIPVIIHLINFKRPKKVAFSTLSFFKKLQQSTIRRLKIKRLLLLILRIAAVSLLALALARPFLPPVYSGIYEASEPQQIGLLIDNSPSMSSIGEKGPFIEQAKEVARNIISKAQSNDSFLINVSNGEAQTVVPVSAERAMSLIDKIKIENKGNYLNEHLNQLKTRIRQTGNKQGSVYLLSDGQVSQYEFLNNELNNQSSEQSPQPVPVQFIKIGNNSQRNVTVSRLINKSQFISRENPVILEAEVTNFSKSAASNQFVTMEIGNRVIGQYQTDLEAGETATFSFDVIPENPGTLKGKVIIEGDDISFDNTHYFSLKIPKQKSVLLVQENEESQQDEFKSYLRPALFAANETNTQLTFERIEAEELDKSDWQNHSAIILDGLTEIPEYLFGDLQAFVQNGKGLFIFPSEKSSIQNYNAFFERLNAGSFEGIRGSYASFNPITKLDQIIEGHPVFEEMFEKKRDENIKLKMPELFYYYDYKAGVNSPGITLLKAVTGDEILVERSYGDGRLLLSMIGSDPGWSNFPVNPLFAPLFFRSALYISTSEEGGFYNYVLGEPLEIPAEGLGNDVEILKDENLIKPEITSNATGRQLIQYSAKEWQPGWAEISDGNHKFHIAANQNILESDLKTFTEKELETLAQKTTTISSVIDVTQLSEKEILTEVTEAGFGKEIWHWFVIVALLLLITETSLNRLYKTDTL